MDLQAWENLQAAMDQTVADDRSIELFEAAWNKFQEVSASGAHAVSHAHCLHQRLMPVCGMAAFQLHAGLACTIQPPRAFSEAPTSVLLLHRDAGIMRQPGVQIMHARAASISHSHHRV